MPSGVDSMLCDCGNSIGVAYSMSNYLAEFQKVTVKCDNCGKVHELMYQGRLITIMGAKKV